MRAANQPLRRALLLLARADVFFYSLAWLMVILVVGTIAQRSLGLYEAQNRYFSSFYFWAGSIPLPGGYQVLGIIFFGIVAKLLVATSWTRAKLGINIVHLGSLALLFGGFLTAAFSYEGSMAIQEGQSSSFVADYHNVELALIDTRPPTEDRVTAFDASVIKVGATLAHGNLPFKLEIVKFFRNTQVRQRSGVDQDPLARGFAKNFDLSEEPLDPASERNRAGVLLRVSGLDVEANGVYALLEHMPIAQNLKVPGGNFRLELRKMLTPLPFRLELQKFDRQTHPGTEIASSYSSDLTLHDGSIQQRVRVQMNEPLRYKGYTFYQASFAEDGAQRTTVLAVVHNMGRLFPYISSLIMSLGLLLHLALQVPRLLASKSERLEKLSPQADQGRNV